MSNIEVTPEQFKSIGSAIVLQAVRDWQDASKKCNNAARAKKEDLDMLRKCEAFFRSDWCDIISPVSGKQILRMLRDGTAATLRGKYMVVGGDGK